MSSLMWDINCRVKQEQVKRPAAGWVQSRVQAMANSCGSEVPWPSKAATVNAPLTFLTSWCESCGLMSSCLGTGFVSCCVLRSTSIQACLFASDQTCPAWDWIQVSYSSAFSFGSHRATFALNCNLAVHGSEVPLSPLLCTENAQQDVHESPGYQAKLKACDIFTHLCIPRHNEGAEIAFCGMMLIVFCPHLTPFEHPHPIIYLVPQFLLQPFPPIFLLFMPLVSDSHRSEIMFLSQASSQSPSLIQTLEVPRWQSSHLLHTSSSP